MSTDALVVTAKPLKEMSLQPNAKILIENKTEMSLPYLSIGVKWKRTNHPVQTIWLPIHDIKPGEIREILSTVEFTPNLIFKLRESML